MSTTSVPHGLIGCLSRLFVGSLFETNLVKVVELESKQRKVADNFTATFPDKTVKQWRRMLEKWEEDPLCPNPYVLSEQGALLVGVSLPWLTVLPLAIKISEARLRLAQEEVAKAERGQHTPHNISASVFVQMGLEIEDQQ